MRNVSERGRSKSLALALPLETCVVVDVGGGRQEHDNEVTRTAIDSSVNILKLHVNWLSPTNGFFLQHVRDLKQALPPAN